MRSLKFPNMFSSNSSNVWKENEYLDATKQNTKLLLQTRRGELFGDPYFGLVLEQYLFDQNNYILREALIDIIYTQIALFIPQIRIRRQDIRIIQTKEKSKVYCQFSGTSQLDFTNNTFNLLLYQHSEE